MGVSKSTKDEEKKFSGELGVGCSHTEFDRTVVSYVLEDYGGAWAKQFWEDTLQDISSVDMSNPEQEYDFQRHCHLVHGCISAQKPKHATTRCRIQLLEAVTSIRTQWAELQTLKSTSAFIETTPFWDPRE